MTKKLNKPPKIAQILLARLLDKYSELPLLGDLEEEYRCVAGESGEKHARLWYWRQVLKSLPNIINNSFYWSAAMFKNYFKIAVRNIKRYKVFSSINILGLTLGLACCLFIMLWIIDELSYDRFYKDSNSLFRVEERIFYSGKIFNSKAFSPGVRA